MIGVDYRNVLQGIADKLNKNALPVKEVVTEPKNIPCHGNPGSF
jgi:hypothetical protein